MSSTAAETQDFLVGFSAASFGVGSLMPTNEAPLGSQAQGKACGQTAKRSQVASFPEAVVAPEGGGGVGCLGELSTPWLQSAPGDGTPRRAPGAFQVRRKTVPPPQPPNGFRWEREPELHALVPGDFGHRIDGAV